MLVAAHVLKNTQIRSLTRISMLCGVAVVISRHTRLVETVQIIRPSNSVLGPGCRSRKNANNNFRAKKSRLCFLLKIMTIVCGIRPSVCGDIFA